MPSAMNLLAKIFPPAFPDLDWIQIGITTRCNASCNYCPHAVFGKSRPQKDLSMEIFKALVPAFSSANLIYLQGWGEPLLHPDLFKMVKTAKEKRCLAGLTTNGNLLTSDKIKFFVDEGLDFLSLSLAGTDEKNDAIRKGTKLTKVLRAIEEIERVKSGSGASLPKVHVAYMLLKSGIEDIPAMSGFFSSLGVDQVVISSLTLGFSREMEKEMVLADSKAEFENLKNRLLEMRDKASNPEKIHFHLYNPFKLPGPCSENVLRSAYIDVEGSVRPCVCTDFSGPDNIAAGQSGTAGLYPLQRHDFGRVSSQEFNHLWHSKSYRKFRREWELGKIPGVCRQCTKPFIDDLSC